jgi:hypothetical protein
MIEDERELEAAQDWLEYWKSVGGDGQQSWFSREYARAQAMRYAEQIREYKRGHPDVQLPSPDGQATDGRLQAGRMPNS